MATKVYIAPSNDGKQRSAYPAGDWTNVNAPTGLTATPSGYTIVFQLTDTNSSAAAYIIQRSETSNGTYVDFATGSVGSVTITTTGNPVGTYYYRAVGIIGSVRSVPTGNISATVSAPSSGPTLLYSNDFETDLSGLAFPGGTPTGSPAYARVTYSPDSGSYALRGNFISNKSDPIANITGSGNTVNLVVPNLRSNTPNACVVKWRQRIDPANYSGAFPYIKLGYWSDVSRSDNTQDAFTLSCSATSGRCSWLFMNSTWLRQTTTGWPPNGANLYLAQTGGQLINLFDGNYHTIEFRFDYVANVFRVFIDGQQIFGRDYHTNGNFSMGPDFHFDRARIIYASYADISTSTDGAGIAGGWQVDNIQVFDGVP